MRDPLRDKIGAALPEPPYITGGPAFPAYPSDAHAETAGHAGYGLSLLDYFAAHVISGLAARSNMTLDDLKNDGPGTAYWIAALMVDLRNRLPIEATPVPPETLTEGPVGPGPEPPAVVTAEGTVVKVSPAHAPFPSP